MVGFKDQPVGTPQINREFTYSIGAQLVTPPGQPAHICKCRSCCERRETPLENRPLIGTPTARSFPIRRAHLLELPIRPQDPNGAPAPPLTSLTQRVKTILAIPTTEAQGTAMQPFLIKPPRFDPAPTGLKHYVIAVQNQWGELRALEHLSDEMWEHVTPLLQIVGPKDRSKPFKRPTVAEWVKKVSQTVGTHACFLDTLRLGGTRRVEPQSGTQPVLAFIYEKCRQRGMNFVPVFPVGTRDPAYLRIVSDAASEDGRGVCLRHSVRETIPPLGYTIERLLAETLAIMNVLVEDADLILDLGFLDPDETISLDLAPVIEASVAVGEWRTLILLGTSMPATLGRISEGTVGSLRRQEWQLWRKLLKTKLPRIPIFGDYGIQHPRPPNMGGGQGMRANIRYTARDTTLVARGEGPAYQEGSAQYKQLCASLVTRTEFKRPAFTWGDQMLADCADGRTAPGWQPMWRGAGTSHHIGMVYEQLLNAGRSA